MKLRCSSLPLNFTCAGSARAPDVLIRESGEAAQLGSAAHLVLEIMLTEGADTARDKAPSIAVDYGVDIDDLEYLLWTGVQLWSQVRDLFPGVLTEVLAKYDLTFPDGTEVELSGHSDICSVSGNVIRGADWKSGYKDHDYSEQMLGYCALMLLCYQEIDEVTFTIFWLREQEIENYTMRRGGQLEAWKERVFKRIVQWDGAFNLGTHCCYCPRSHECPGANAAMRRDVSAILNLPVLDAPTSLQEMSPDQLILLVRQASVVTTYAERARNLVRQHVEMNGPISGTSSDLILKPEERKSLKPLEAWPVLEGVGFTQEELAEVVKISRTKCADVVKRKAGKGNGSAAIRDLNAALDKAGAVETQTIHKMTERRK